MPDCVIYFVLCFLARAHDEHGLQTTIPKDINNAWAGVVGEGGRNEGVDSLSAPDYTGGWEG